ncbi:MAG: hypothetical protein M1828_004916 [Chrysothrix sp. TS-e1954]|nr:MAG: hypothetical protein M1828_004916 [Chrysothrix sp. TS-e1954]
MSVQLGKRKRRSPQPHISKSEPCESPTNANVQDAFKRAFEASFAPLPHAQNCIVSSTHGDTFEVAQNEDEDEEEDAWSGITEDEEPQNAVVVVEHEHALRTKGLTKAEAKAFMNSKPPSSTAPSSPPKFLKQSKPAREEEDDQLNLKNDLALQRLISESHLLDPNKATATREKLVDSRLKTLGAKKSILQQEKMPMSHRIGIAKKGAEREEKRRREAKENGIVLERVQGTSKSRVRKDRGIDGPTVGKFKGGTLSLSKRDVAKIKGAPARKRKGR